MESRHSLTSTRIFSDLILLTTAMIWGGGFVSQRVAARYLSFFAFNGVRFLLAGLVMLPFVIKLIGKPDRRLLWILPAGGLLFAGSALQQAGMESTSAANGGFLTSVYVVLVPLFMALFWKKSTPAINWVAAIVAVAGSYLLSTNGMGILPTKGDLLVLIGSVLWALHVIVVGLAVNRLNVFVFSTGQFLLAGLLHLGFSAFTQPVTLPDLQAALPAVLYAGLGSVAIGFTLQAVGQKYAPAADAALILSLESVFAAVGGYFILREGLTPVQFAGAALIFTAITFAQLMQVKKKRTPIPSTQPEIPPDPVP
ncbi:MAG TPA: EamA family transporter [Anaerolineaceae bacterium]|jgi:drug/metabolite transporter (DMT)-like permease|nr:EamA family transporter [Anaerolineaceae bacterium]